MPPAQICSDIATHTALRPEDAQLAEFRHFLDQHQLLRPDAQASARLQRQGQGERWFSWSWFFCITIYFSGFHCCDRNNGWADRACLARAVYAWAAAAVVGLTVLGIVLTLHQWDTFRAAVVESFFAQRATEFWPGPGAGQGFARASACAGCHPAGTAGGAYGRGLCGDVSDAVHRHRRELETQSLAPAPGDCCGRHRV